MGQQQLLLIVLVMILVGAAILVGMQVYDESNRETAISTITKDLINLSTIAINYYRTPVELGGGGQSFISKSSGSWSVPSNLDSLDNRIYATNTVTNNSVELIGQSIDEKTGRDGLKGVQVYLTMDKYGVKEVKIMN